jgi:hypothetical protein
MATPEATFFLFHFHLFTTNVTRALSLEAIKGEAGATSRAMESNRVHLNRNNNIDTHAPPLKRDLGSTLSGKLVTPTTSTLV